MKTIFSSLHARAFAHATEDIEKVKISILNSVGNTIINVKRTEGHHGNPIEILESAIEDGDEIESFFRKLSVDDLRTLHTTLQSRVDEGCNLFIKLDKQSALKGDIRLGSGDDVISVRVKIRAFPARCEIAQGMIAQYLDELASKKASAS